MSPVPTAHINSSASFHKGSEIIWCCRQAVCRSSRYWVIPGVTHRIPRGGQSLSYRVSILHVILVCCWFYKSDSATQSSWNLTLRWTPPEPGLPWRTRWSTSGSCSRLPVSPSARCHSAVLGLPGGCCWCTVLVHCWEYLESRGFLNVKRNIETKINWQLSHLK